MLEVYDTRALIDIWQLFRLLHAAFWPQGHSTGLDTNINWALGPSDTKTLMQLRSSESPDMPARNLSDDRTPPKSKRNLNSVCSESLVRFSEAAPQAAQYGLLKEYTLNYRGIPNMI